MVSYAIIGIIILGIAVLIGTALTIYWKWHSIQYMLGIGGWVIDCEIYEVRGERGVWKTDVARRRYDPDGEWEKLEFLNRAEDTQPPGRDALYQKQDGRVKAMFVSPKTGIYNPVTIQRMDENQLEMVELGMDIKNWGVQAIEQAHESYTNEQPEWYETAMAQWIGAGIFVLLALIGGGWYLESIANQVGNAANSLTQAAQTMAGNGG